MGFRGLVLLEYCVDGISRDQSTDQVFHRIIPVPFLSYAKSRAIENWVYWGPCFKDKS